MALPKFLIYAVFTLYLSLTSHYLRGVYGRQNDRLLRLKSSSLNRPTINIREKIIEWQCYAICSTSKDLKSFESCQTQCKADKFTYPRAGKCPPLLETSKRENHILEDIHCLDGCRIDYDCPDIQKCCDSVCGPICVIPLNLLDDVLLPPIPKILHLRLPRGHKVEITIQTSANTTTYYHVETRHHIGLRFSPRKLSTWQWQPVEMTAEEILENKKKRIQICFNLKPGRWYQVRIAAINAYGFRGYSEPSKPFTLSKNPRPPMAPDDLQVIDATFNGKLYTIKIEWCPSKSNLPVEKYKIIWSLYVKTRDESIISNEAYIKDAYQYEIHNLLPDSSYYIQVLAMSINGSRRLKSDKISMLFNSTRNSLKIEPLKCHSVDKDRYKLKKRSQHQSSESNSSSKTSIDTTSPFEVRFRYNPKFGLMGQISGLQSDKEKFYELCSENTNCEYKKYSAIRAKKNTLEFNALKYNTAYFLKMVQPNVFMEFHHRGSRMYNGSHDSFTFKTPECESIQKRFPRIKLKC